MNEPLLDHDGTVSIGGRAITDVRFTGDIDCLAGSESKFSNLMNNIDATSTTYGTEINIGKHKL